MQVWRLHVALPTWIITRAKLPAACSHVQRARGRWLPVWSSYSCAIEELWASALQVPARPPDVQSVAGVQRVGHVDYSINVGAVPNKCGAGVPNLISSVCVSFEYWKMHWCRLARDISAINKRWRVSEMRSELKHHHAATLVGHRS